MCDDDKFGGLQVYMLCMMMISLGVRKFGRLHVVCDDDKFGSLEIIKFTHVVCDDDMFGSLEVRKFTYCVW